MSKVRVLPSQPFGVEQLRISINPPVAFSPTATQTRMTPSSVSCRRSPCQECPWRKDLWVCFRENGKDTTKANLALTAVTGLPPYPVGFCHMEPRPICGGWLARYGKLNSATEHVEVKTDLPLYSGYQELLESYGITEDEVTQVRNSYWEWWGNLIERADYG